MLPLFRTIAKGSERDVRDVGSKLLRAVSRRIAELKRERFALEVLVEVAWERTPTPERPTP